MMEFIRPKESGISLFPQKLQKVYMDAIGIVYANIIIVYVSNNLYTFMFRGGIK